MTAQWITDPGHGWLKVRLGYAYGLDISGFSYMDKKYAYLEEDCDAGVFFKKYPKETISFAPEVYMDEMSPVREMMPFEQ